LPARKDDDGAERDGPDHAVHQDLEEWHGLYELEIDRQHAPQRKGQERGHEPSSIALFLGLGSVLHYLWPPGTKKLW
jgi:hypothetical protein